MRYPALDVTTSDRDAVYVVVDDHSPTAVEEHDDGLTIYFATSSSRDRARSALASLFPHASVASRDVDDEDWARRSQQSLTPITVGRITVAPPWCTPNYPITRSPDHPIHLVIQPSMGFGTGHHATTRLCLRGLQRADVAGGDVLDVGTGSGVLAIAASRLGARRAVGIDCDEDAVRSALDNLRLNPEAAGVTFEVADLTDWLTPGRTFDLVTANLTGVMLERTAARLLEAVKPGGAMIVSGVMTAERASVRAAFGGADLVEESEEEGWVGLTFRIA